MKVVAAVFADFAQAPAGGPSRLLTPLAGRPVLWHTLERLLRVEGVAARCLFVRPRDEEPAARFLREAELNDRVELLAKDDAPRPRRLLLTTARKWNLESWRGGLLGTTWFDEFVDPHATALLINHYKCQAIFCVEGHQPVFDPAISTAMVAHLREHDQECKIVFTQAPPGLTGILVTRACLEDLLEFNIPLGMALSYRPELPQPDPITFYPCYQLPPEVVQTPARLVADTRRSCELIEAALVELGHTASADALVNWLRQPDRHRAGVLPVEVELELTTADPLPDTTLRPRGTRVPARQLDNLDVVTRLTRELAAYDDRLVVLGGAGDPLQHPRFAEVCGLLRVAGVFGLCVTTPLVDLTDDQLAALFVHRVDVLEILLDAHTPATYQRVQRRDVYGRVIANIERIEQVRRQRQAPQPIIVPSITRCAATIGEIERFYDDWIRKTGFAVIRGYNDYCGLLPRDSLLSTTPLVRGPCRRLSSRLTLWADGKASACSQDVAAKTSVGDWFTEQLADVWAGSRLAALREAHKSLSLEAFPICVTCGEWNRP